MQLEMLHMLVEKGRRMNQDGGGGGGGWGVCICGGEGRSDRRRRRSRKLATNKQTTALQSLFFFSFFYKRIATVNSVSCPVTGNTIAPRHIQHPSLATPQYP